MRRGVHGLESLRQVRFTLPARSLRRRSTAGNGRRGFSFPGASRSAWTRMSFPFFPVHPPSRTRSRPPAFMRGLGDSDFASPAGRGSFPARSKECRGKRTSPFSSSPPRRFPQAGPLRSTIGGPPSSSRHKPEIGAGGESPVLHPPGASPGRGETFASRWKTGRLRSSAPSCASKACGLSSYSLRKRAAGSSVSRRVPSKSQRRFASSGDRPAALFPPPEGSLRPFRGTAPFPRGLETCFPVEARPVQDEARARGRQGTISTTTGLEVKSKGCRV